MRHEGGGQRGPDAVVGSVGAESLREEFEVDDAGGVAFGEAVEDRCRGFEEEIPGLGVGGGGWGVGRGVGVKGREAGPGQGGRGVEGGD